MSRSLRAQFPVHANALAFTLDLAKTGDNDAKAYLENRLDPSAAEKLLQPLFTAIVSLQRLFGVDAAILYESVRRISPAELQRLREEFDQVTRARALTAEEQVRYALETELEFTVSGTRYAVGFDGVGRVISFKTVKTVKDSRTFDLPLDLERRLNRAVQSSGQAG